MNRTPRTVLSLLLTTVLPLLSAETGWPEATAPTIKAGSFDELVINGRAVEVFQHGVRPEWGYKQPQQDTFIVVHPQDTAQKRAALRRSALGGTRCGFVFEMHAHRRQPRHLPLA